MAKSITEPISSIAAGSHHSLAVTKSGLIMACGCNEEGQLGTNDERNTLVFTYLKDMQHININQIAAGNRHSAAISKSNELYIWGTGAFGEFKIPHLVKSIKGTCSKVSLGQDFGAVVTHQGKVYVWGNSTSGKLGLGIEMTQATPCKVPYLKNKAVESIS